MASNALAAYPYVVVRISCTMCTRQGRYRLARLAEKFGANIGLDDLLLKLTADCAGAGRSARHPYRRICKARFIDLDGPRRPPDLPPAMMPLRVIEGGRPAELELPGLKRAP